MENSSCKKSWIKDVHKSLADVSSNADYKLWTKCSIYRIPACIKDLNSKIYRPQVVSFGPFHHGDEKLKPMEGHKHRALLRFLKRSNRPLDDFFSAVEEVVGQLQDSYENPDEQWINDKDSFIQLMIVDGCFMLELMSKLTGIPIVKSQTQTTPSIAPSDHDYADNDPIFSSHGILYAVPFIRRDMLLLENQLPLLVLETLFATATNSAKSTKNEDFINRLVLRSLDRANAFPPGMGLGLHPLHLYRQSLLQGPSPPQPRSRHGSNKPSTEIIRSAVELYEAGIRFKRIKPKITSTKSTCLHEVEFSRHGLLTLPRIQVDDTTEYVYLNLMAFERLHVGAGHEVTSFVIFMDNIIDSAKDVGLLSSKGIIENSLGSDKEVAQLFNSLSKDVVLEKESHLDEVLRKMHGYCKRPWNMWRANLCHTYFRNPWAIMSLLAAIFLIVMTAMQTTYTSLQYYHQSPPAAPSPH